MNNQDNKFNNRVYGCAIIKSINSNYNADFTKQPRTLPDGTVYATDKALKYTIRNFLIKNYPQDKVLYFTRYKSTVEKPQDNIKPRDLKELYEFLFNELPVIVPKTKQSDKFILFYCDGEKIYSKCKKPKKTKELTTFFKDNEGETPLIHYKNDFNDFIKYGKELKIEEIKEGDINKDKPQYFYVNKDNKISSVEIDDDFDFEEAIDEYDLLMNGGYDKLKILYQLLNCIDVRFFGATFTGDTNVSIHGPVQINHAKDRFYSENDNIENLTYSEDLKAPFRNPKDTGVQKNMTTKGLQYKSMEAHYIHHFSINPKNLDDFVTNANILCNRPITNENEKPKELVGLTNSDIIKLTEGLKSGATFYDSSSKAGVENELLLWVQLREGSKLVLPNFTELITVKRNNDKIEIDLTGVNNILKNIPKMKVEKDKKEIEKNQIEKIDLYYNPNIELIGIPEIEEDNNSIFNKYNIFTGAQISNEDNSN